MGAHTALSSVRSTMMAPCNVRTRSPRSLLTMLVVIIVSLHLLVVVADDESDHILVKSNMIANETDILLKFKDSLSDEKQGLVTWDSSNSKASPCTGDKANWVGVLCSKGSVYGLKIEDMGLKGRIDTDTLTKLPNLRTLSFMKNSFDGALPELKKLGALKSVYLSNNHFSGEIMDNAFEGMLSLKKVHLAQNGFSGKIPKSLTQLPKLLDLRLEGNQFEGEIPSFPYVLQLKSFNVSNNALVGSIPASLVKMEPSSFIGNKDLCGVPIGKECVKSSSWDQRKTSPAIIGTAIAAVVMAIMAIIAGIFLLRRRRHTPSSSDAPNMQTNELDQMEKGSSSGQSGTSKRKAAPDQGKLSFLRDDREQFDLQDLLKASAEILGGGVFGSSYKASLVNDVNMVVKRFRHMNNVGKEEFQEHMTRLGRLRHQNLLPVVAYYYRKEEKLLIFDYVTNGSLALHLHGNNKSPSLDWAARLRIVKGIGKGLTYLYNELPSLTTPHGHLKSSNILLDASFEPLLTDYGLVPITNQEHSQEIMVAYKSPEYSQHGRITKKTDVWSFGVLILEILTGRYPANFLQCGKGRTGAGVVTAEGDHHNDSNDSSSDDEADIAKWVRSVGSEDEWRGGNKRVFDKEMGGTKNSEGEMMKLLKIGLLCCESDTEKRIELKEAMEKIDELRDFDDEFYSSCNASEGDVVSSSRNVSDDLSYVSVKL